MKKMPVGIAKHGKPVANLAPANEEKDDIFNFFAGQGAVIGDVISPVISQHEWGQLK